MDEIKKRTVWIINPKNVVFAFLSLLFSDPTGDLVTSSHNQRLKVNKGHEKTELRFGKYLILITGIVLFLCFIPIISAAVPVAQFNGVPTSGAPPLTVTFKDMSTGSPTGWAWFFGDESYTRPWIEMTANAGWSARHGYSTVALPDGSIVLMGGIENIGGGNLGNKLKNDVWRSTDKGKTWTQMTADAEWSARAGHSSVAMPDGSILLMGGSDISSTGVQRLLNDVWISTDKGATWTQVMPSSVLGGLWGPREYPSSVVLPDGSIVLMGGYVWEGDYLHDVWRSTDKGATWTQMTSNAGWSAINGPSCVAMPDGSVVLMAGAGNDIWRSMDNGVSWKQVIAHAEWSARGDPKSVVLPDGSIVLMGGTDYTIGDLNDVWRFQPGFFGEKSYGHPWTEMTASSGWAGRDLHTSVIMPDGSIVLMGGIDGSYNTRNDVWRSTDNGVTWTQMTSNAGWSPRSDFSSVAMPDGSIVLMGGIDKYSNFKNDTWRSTDNGKTWTLMSESSGWLARYGQTSVVMPDGSIVLMGGVTPLGSGKRLNDVWRSTDNGKTWTQLTVNAGWSGRFHQSSVVIPGGSIVLMGGKDDSGYKNDVWRSTDNGKTWTQLTASAGWSMRWEHSSVVLSDGSIVLMGGYDGTNYFNDVWRSTDSGTIWMQLSNAEWSARTGHTSVATLDGSIVLMGGYTKSGGMMNDVWRLDPSAPSAQYPSHTYTLPGMYSVALQASNADGYNGILKIGYITVNAPSTAGEIMAFNLPGVSGAGTAVITSTSSTTGTITITVPYGTDKNALIPTFTLSSGATAQVGSTAQVSGKTANNFNSPVTYVITAADGITKKTWIVTVATAPNTAAEITSYSLPGQIGSSVINSGTGTIQVTVPSRTNVNSMIASFILSPSATAKVSSVPQISGVTANNFASPVTYVVTAEDGITTKTWTVTVIINVKTEIKIVPKTLNLGSKGYFIAFITLPDGYSGATFDMKTVTCSGAPAVRMMRVKIFPRIVGFVFKTSDLKSVQLGKKVTLTVTGELNNKFRKYIFAGSDTVNVISKPLWQSDDIKDVSHIADDQLFKTYSP
jgi:PKD repeat protein